MCSICGGGGGVVKGWGGGKDGRNNGENRGLEKPVANVGCCLQGGRRKRIGSCGCQKGLQNAICKITETKKKGRKKKKSISAKELEMWIEKNIYKI